MAYGRNGVINCGRPCFSLQTVLFCWSSAFVSATSAAASAFIGNSVLRRSQGRINLCRADECVHIVGIERQGTFEIVAGARQKFASNSLIVPD